MACGSCSSGGGCGSGGCSSGGCGTCPAMHVYDWLNDFGVAAPPVTFELVEIIFKGQRKGIYRNTRSLDLQTGDFVIVEADRGVDFGTVHMVGELVRLRIKGMDRNEDASYSNVVRVASLDDIEHRILRPIWRDPRTHYAVNCASLGKS